MNSNSLADIFELETNTEITTDIGVKNSEKATGSSPECYNNSIELLTSNPAADFSDKSIPKYQEPFADLDDWKQHIAIQAFKQVSGYYPKKQLAGRVANCLSENPDVGLLQNCHDLWVSKGYNPMNRHGCLSGIQAGCTTRTLTTRPSWSIPMITNMLSKDMVRHHTGKIFINS